MVYTNNTLAVTGTPVVKGASTCDTTQIDAKMGRHAAQPLTQSLNHSETPDQVRCIRWVQS